MSNNNFISVIINEYSNKRQNIQDSYLSQWLIKLQFSVFNMDKCNSMRVNGKVIGKWCTYRLMREGAKL